MIMLCPPDFALNKKNRCLSLNPRGRMRRTGRLVTSLHYSSLALIGLEFQACLYELASRTQISCQKKKKKNV